MITMQLCVPGLPESLQAVCEVPQQFTFQRVIRLDVNCLAKNVFSPTLSKSTISSQAETSTKTLKCKSELPKLRANLSSKRILTTPIQFKSNLACDKFGEIIVFLQSAEQVFSFSEKWGQFFSVWWSARKFSCCKLSLIVRFWSHHSFFFFFWLAPTRGSKINVKIQDMQARTVGVRASMQSSLVHVRQSCSQAHLNALETFVLHQRSCWGSTLLSQQKKTGNTYKNWTMQQQKQIK